MLSELRETNQKLREKLQTLQQESTRLCGDTERFTEPSSLMDASSTKTTTSRRNPELDDVPTPCGGVTSSYRGTPMLSDRAKHIRGEASKRIDGLLHDWKDYKERAEDELRRRYRTEQHLREMLARKDREATEMAQELSTLRVVSEEQKKMVDQLTTELEADEKYRAKCADLESQMGKLNRFITELTEENYARDELIKTYEAERESLTAINSELREKNTEQTNKIESCERDVNETRMELEILEEVVRALNEKKMNMFSYSTASAGRPVTPNMAVDFTSTIRSQAVPPATSSKANTSSPPYYHLREDITPIPYNNSTNASPQPPKTPPPTRRSTLTNEDSERALADRLSAMSALKSLQKDHSAKCDYLADHIQKLKDENKAKDKALSDYQTTTDKKKNSL